MGMKEQQRAVYRSMQGREIDMNKLMNQNEMTVAVGNAKVNARGDELGPGGKVIRKREELLRDADSRHVPDEQVIRKVLEPSSVPAMPVVDESPKKTTSKTQPKNLTDEDPV